MPHPTLPSKIGTSGKTKEPVTGIISKFQITDEVTQVQSDNNGKKILLQKVEFEDGKIELRLGYYIIGKKPKMLGRWVWGQYATFMPIEDFVKIVEKAQAKGWFQV